MDAIKEFLLSPTGLGYIALALITLGILAKNLWPKKAGMIEKIEGMVFKAFNLAEKAIPDEAVATTPLGKAFQKADTFLKEFCKLYEKKHGKAPSKEEETKAVDMAEKMVYHKNLGR